MAVLLLAVLPRAVGPGLVDSPSHRSWLPTLAAASSSWSARAVRERRANLGTGLAAAADLQIEMTASPNPVTVGSNLTYTIMVTNLGPAKARTVTMTDTLAGNMTFVSCTATAGGVCKGSGAKRKVTFGAVNPGGSMTVTLVATVKPKTGSGVTIENRAHVASGATADPNPANNHATVVVTTPTPSANLGVTLQASPDTVLAQENVTYTATLTNQGPAAAANVVLTDNLPPPTSFVSCVASAGGVCSGSGNAQTVSFSSLPASASATVSLVAQVQAGVAGGTALPDTVMVQSSLLDPTPSDNSATAQATVGEAVGQDSVADLSLTLTAAPDPVFPDSTLTFALTISNLGPLEAQSVVVTDSLPAFTTFVSCAATGGGACDGVDNARTVSFPRVTAGDSASITLVTTVSGLLTDGTPITDRAVVASSTLDPSASNDSAAVSVIVGRQRPPDIVLILSDDQPHHTLPLMPQVNSLIGAQGVRFSNYYVSTPLCAPSRATLFTGLYSHNHGVLGNGSAAALFNDTSTLATWLQSVGYRTALVGKYINHYDEIAPHIPPGWNEWRVFLGGPELETLYYNYDLVENGVIVHYDSSATNYATTVLTQQAVAFIEQVPSAQPFFLEFAPNAPHTPANPAVEDLTALDGLPPYRPPSYNEADVSDKPRWVRDLPLLTAADDEQLAALHENMGESLLAVDRGVAAIVDALSRTGRLANAVIIYAGDNGYSLGAHRWERKLCTFEECIKQALLIRAPGIAPRDEPALASNIDLASTIAEFAGIQPPGSVNGRSLVPLLHDPSSPWRDAVLLENLSANGAKHQFYALRNERYLYGEYFNGDRELYDLSGDPYELLNVVTDPGYVDVASLLAAQLAQLKAE